MLRVTDQALLEKTGGIVQGLPLIHISEFIWQTATDFENKANEIRRNVCDCLLYTSRCV